ncbi:DUF3754 domain-containing protein [Candidatus Uabimicrobium sp. HlEnr_7]|uniref:DUF3754 domain-containing protein n=1 Tax=Candidatus Uabimicrobium helgolandensis TaxID=3095367 RepID=UPI003556BF73
MSEIIEDKIPIDKQELIENLANSLPANQQQDFRYFAKLLNTFCKDKFSISLEKLKTHYRPFNPDTESPVYLNDTEEQYYAKDLAEKFHVFLQQQNYQKINDHDILDILEQYRLRGVKIAIPRNQYRDLVVYFRDESTEYRSYRKWYTLWLRKYHSKNSSYKKLAVLFRPYHENFTSSFAFRLRKKLKKIESPRSFILPQPITLKLFKNISEESLPVLFPGISVEMGIFSRVWVSLLSCAVAVSLALMFFYTWTCLIIIFASGCFITRELFVFLSKSTKYNSKLLDNFYHNSLNNNSGVISHLIQHAEEDVYKQILLITYAFWVKERWAFYPIHTNSIKNYVEDLALQRFGVKIEVDVERIAYQLLSNSGGDKWLEMPKLIDAIYPNKAYIKNDCSENDDYIKIDEAEEPLPHSGKIIVSPGTENEEYAAFSRKEFRLYIDKEKSNHKTTQYSHAPGASVRWIPEQPIITKLASVCKEGSDTLNIFSGDLDNIPLRGIGKIGNNGDVCEFRYVRIKNKSELYLTTALRYRHAPHTNAPVMVRLVPPSFKTETVISEGTREIALPEKISFPETGFVLVSTSEKSKYIEYQLHKNNLLLEEPVQIDIAIGTEIRLVQPQAVTKQKLKRGNYLIPVPNSKLFRIRGVLIIGANTKNEERVPYQRPVIKLELEKPLQFRHSKGAMIQIESHKLRLLRDFSAGAKYILAHGSIESIKKGQAIISPGENNRETFHFELSQQYLHLLKPLSGAHEPETTVEENIFESTLKYEATQGSYFITLEDASSFSLSGSAEINFTGKFGIKEKWPFRREKGSNTLILTKKMDKSFASGTSISIIGVEATTTTKIPYHHSFLDIDFSSVPRFPQQGKIIIEPGSQSKEEIEFNRYPNRLNLADPLRHSHKKGAVIEFCRAPEFVTSEPITSQNKKILVENAHLLPDRGKIVVQDEVVKYYKTPARVLLMQPCRYYHVRGSLVQLPEISQNIKLAEYAEKGSKEIKVVNAQELPKKGTIEIHGFFAHAVCTFSREGDTLYLNEPLTKSFSTRAKLKLPDLYLRTHLSPGMEYLEISDPSCLPGSGIFLITTSHTGRRKKRKDEVLHFRYCPETLWLDTPLKKSYSANITVETYDYNIGECGSLQANNMKTATEKLKSFLHSKLLE